MSELNEALHKWLNGVGTTLTQGVRLIEEIDEPEKLSPEGQRAYALAVAITGETSERRRRSKERAVEFARRRGIDPEDHEAEMRLLRARAKRILREGKRKGC